MSESIDADLSVDDFLEDRESSPLRDICMSLDDAVLTLFETLDAIHRCQTDLNVAMKSGYLLMAKARYSMGSKKVSSLQYDLSSNDQALVHVDVHNDDSPPTFQVISDSPVSTTQQNVRRRQTNTSDGSKTNTGDPSRIQDIEMKEIGGGDCLVRKRDPIKWFGLLVPQPLRESQRRFSSCAQLCCELATLKARLTQQQQQFLRLMKSKREMIEN